MSPLSFASEPKWARILRYLTDGGRLTRFDAETIGDHSLNSTVSNIQAMGVVIAREPTKLEGRFGPIRCCRYWLEPEQLQAAHKLLERT